MDEEYAPGVTYQKQFERVSQLRLIDTRTHTINYFYRYKGSKKIFEISENFYSSAQHILQSLRNRVRFKVDGHG